MFRRVFTAPLLALSLLASAGVVADVEAASLPAGTTATTVTQVAAPQAAAPQTPAAALYCGAGLVGTLCAAVLYPICHDRCLGDAAPAVPATPTGAALAPASARVATGARAGATSADIVCARGFEILCTVLGLTVCRNHPCGATPAADVVAINPRELCTVNIRPINPFCLLP